MTFNLSFYSNPQVDQWIDDGTKLEAVDKKASAEAWHKAYQQVLNDAAAMYIADPRRLIAHRANLLGIESDPAYETVFFYGLHRAGS